jgi:SAM-dependent methyltransferase
MNVFHRWLCSSDRWANTVQQHVIPWALEGVEIGSNVLEVGPGYGATTEVLRGRVARLTCVEVDPQLAESLRRRALGQNVTIVCEDATAMSLPNASFDGALCFTMLHHVPSMALQNRLLREVARVLRPGGMFAGTDSLTSLPFRLLHFFDTLVPVDPRTFANRLRAEGFADVQVDVDPYAFRFRARKPLL